MILGISINPISPFKNRYTACSLATLSTARLEPFFFNASYANLMQGNLSTSVLVDVAETLGAECGIKSGSLREAEDFLAEALETRISGDA